MTKIKLRSKITILSLLAAVVVIGGGVFIYTQKSGQSKVEPATTNAQKETVNLDPPTENEKKQAEDNKQQINDNAAKVKAQQEQNSGSGLRTVKPVVTYAEQNGNKIEVGSYVPGIFEDGGTCTIELTNGAKITRSVSAVKEGNATYCPTVSVDSSEFASKGMWQASVSYKSSFASGQSDTTKFEVR